MGTGTALALSGRTILIVESDVRFLDQLQKALEAEGADVLVVRDPHSVVGAQRLTRSVFSAAVINDWYGRVDHSLPHVPVLPYGKASPVPARADAIIGELKRLLGIES
jgi:hypothetical protein